MELLGFENDRVHILMPELSQLALSELLTHTLNSDAVIEVDTDDALTHDESNYIDLTEINDVFKEKSPTNTYVLTYDNLNYLCEFLYVAGSRGFIRKHRATLIDLLVISFRIQARLLDENTALKPQDH